MLEGPYRAGPWPGLTPSGAGILLACAAFLAIGQVLVGAPEQPLPDLPVVGATALLPMAIATRIVRVPGAASAVCGAYLLPRSLIGLLQPALGQPPLLLVAAILFDVALWLRTAELTVLVDLAPRRPRSRPRRPSPARRLTRRRALVAGGVFGLILALIEPAFRLFLGGNPATWTGPLVWVAAAVTTAVCAAVATAVSARGTAA